MVWNPAQPAISTRRLLSSLVLVVLFQCLLAVENGGFDHRAHAVPGADKLVYDINNDGSEEVALDGSGSHSHYFEAGPPIRSGIIVAYEWSIQQTGEVFCVSKTCSHRFPVGETSVSLKVTDNTGDSAQDSVSINVLPRSAATTAPRIDRLNPGKGPSLGRNIVTIEGDHLYSDSVVFFGTERAGKTRQVDLQNIICEAPPGHGTVDVTVVSQLGTSNAYPYSYVQGASVPIDFRLSSWQNPDGSEFIVEEISCITIGKDHRYYLGSLTGYVTVAAVSRELVVESSCRGAYMGENRVITGIGFNPVEAENRLFVSTNTHFHRKAGVRWDNGKVEVVNVESDGCPSRGETIISGLPCSNHDHGVSQIAFHPDGKMLVTIGSFSNAGYSTAEDGVGGVPENPLSASVVEADYRRSGFNGKIEYDQYDDPGSANVVSGDVELFCTGLRNSFGMIVHSNGQIYATDNGPNTNFGPSSTSCTTDGPDPESEDKLVRLLRGQYYGHPNRNRGRSDSRQCKYIPPWESSADGYVQPIGMMESSTNGIIEFRANVFQGALKGNLFMSKVSFGEQGKVWRAELSDNGEWLSAGPYQFQERSGVSLVQGLYGELVMPQLKKYYVLVYQPQEIAPRSVQLINVYPTRGPKRGGNILMLTGHHLNKPEIVVMVGDNPCINYFYVDYQHLKCTAPPGFGKVKVVVKSGEFESASYDHEYEYW